MIGPWDRWLRPRVGGGRGCVVRGAWPRVEGGR